MFLLLLALPCVAPAEASAPAAAPEPVGAAVSAAPALVGQYDAVRLALVADRLDAATSAAQELATAWAADAPLAAVASTLAMAADLTRARTSFGELSKLVLIRLAAGDGPKVLVYHCPMFQGFAWWIQQKPGIANPYMGQAMPTCGVEVSLKAGAKAAASANFQGGSP